MTLKEQIAFDVEKTVSNLASFIKENVGNLGKDGVILGLSGGLDSACVLGLAAQAIDKTKILCLLMPERDSSLESEEDALLTAQTFKVKTQKIDLTQMLSTFGVYNILPPDAFAKREKIAKIIKFIYTLFPKEHSPFIGGLGKTKFTWQRKIQAYYRIKHRLRLVTLYYYAEQLNYLVAGTANLTEYLTGFFVKYGDDSADIMPIIKLYKTQVRKLSKFIGVPTKIIEKTPTPDLLPGIHDEQALGITYEKLDLILCGLTNGVSEKEITDELDISERTLNYIKHIVELSKYMREIPEGDICKKEFLS